MMDMIAFGRGKRGRRYFWIWVLRCEMCKISRPLVIFQIVTITDNFVAVSTFIIPSQQLLLECDLVKLIPRASSLILMRGAMSSSSQPKVNKTLQLLRAAMEIMPSPFGPSDML